MWPADIGGSVLEETKAVLEPKYYGTLDGLRAFSAIGIVLMHVRANANYAIDGFIFNGLIPSFTMLVYLFMMISAFSMCCGYYDKIMHNEISVGQFYGKRYARVWPFFALLCLIDLLLSPSISALYEVFANLTLCFGLLPNADISVIGVGWFLGTVFVFYFLFPFFCYLMSDKRRAWFSLGVAYLFNRLCTVYFFDESHGLVGDRSNILYSAVFFVAGGLIFLYRDRIGAFVRKHRLLALFAAIGSAAVYFVIGSYIAVMVVMFAFFLIYALGNFGGALKNPVTKFLGSISMEIYLCHMVSFRLLEKLGMLHLFASDAVSYTVTAIATIVGAICFSVIVSKGIKMTGVYFKKISAKFSDKQ